MPKAPPPSTRPLPGWLVLVGSVLVAFHFFAILMHVLAAPSGPWMTRFGPDTAVGPFFAQGPNERLRPYYLLPLKMTHTYHFATNRPEVMGVFFEVRLKDRQGKPMATMRFPDREANFWVRHRQAILAQSLAADVPVQPRPGEAIPAPGQKAPTVTIWEPVPDERMLRLETIPEHKIPRNRPVERPSELSLVLARSYARYVCRKYGAASAELVRRTRPAILSGIVLIEPLPPDVFEDLACNFGEHEVEK